MGRKISVLVLITVMFVSVSARLFFLAKGGYEIAGVSGATRTVSVSKLRGNIYDCNGKKLVNEKEEIFVAAKPCTKSADILKEHLSERQYFNLLSRVSRNEIFLEETDGFECDEDVAKTVKVLKRYDKDQTACHVIGYINSIDNNGICALEKSYDDFLKEDGMTLKLRYSSNAQNDVLNGANIEFLSDNYYSKKGIKLTLDKEIQKFCENAMKLYSNDCGACVVMDAENSEVKAMMSTPGFEPDNVSKYLNDDNSPLLNRALNSYSVGSVFKTVVAAAAIKNGYENFEHFCKGNIQIRNYSFSCLSGVSHKKEDLSSALANSCNTFFISLAKQMGYRKIMETAENLGFGQSFELCGDIVSSSGYLPPENEVNSDGELANLSFGQGSLMASPLQIAVSYCALINGGEMNFPKLVMGKVDTQGNFTGENRKYLQVRALDKQSSLKVRELLEKNFTFENYTCAKPSYNCSSGGKTSTAQTGWYDENGKEILHSWFAGFVRAGDTDYVIVVFKENGKSGASDCAPIFKEIADRIIIYRRNS